MKTSYFLDIRNELSKNMVIFMSPFNGLIFFMVNKSLDFVII